MTERREYDANENPYRRKKSTPTPDVTAEDRESAARHKPDTRRRCFRPCRPGKYCACKGAVIPDEQEPSSCGYQGHEFGASYPDSICIDGFLWDADSGDHEDGFTSGGDIPCPNCNASKYEAFVRDQRDF